MYLNPNLFFLLKDGDLFVWDYKAHQQYQIDLSVFQELMEISKSHKASQSIQNDLELAGLISTIPYPSYPWQWDRLSHIFHIGTQNIGDTKKVSHREWIQAHLDYNLSVELDSEDLFYHLEGPQILLNSDTTALEKVSFKEVLFSRKTSRQFQKKTVSFDTFSTLMYTCFGTVHKDFAGNNPHFVGLRKTSPSGGGLHPTECFIIAWAIEGISPGIYHYNVKNHALTYCASLISYEALKEIFYGQPYAEDCAIGLFLVSRLDLVWKKYPHSRSYRDALIDAGLVSQSTLLTATALGLCTWESGLFHDMTVSEMLHMSDYPALAPLFFMALGH